MNVSDLGIQVSQSLVPCTSTTGSAVTNSRHTCGICQQSLSSKADLQVHSQQLHHGSVAKPYRCQTCGKCFANSSYLSQHLRIHLGLKKYVCRTCERRFTQLSHLQQHIRTHTGDKPYRCQHVGCCKAFSQLSNLQSHMRSHMTDRPFRCNSCYKCFREEAALREHIPKHNETKHLKTKICPVCGKSYAQETYLSRHMLRHQAASATDRVSTAVRPNLPSISLYVSQPASAAVVPTPVYQAPVGSCYPQLPSALSQQSAAEPVRFHVDFLSDQLN